MLRSMLQLAVQICAAARPRPHCSLHTAGAVLDSIGKSVQTCCCDHDLGARAAVDAGDTQLTCLSAEAACKPPTDRTAVVAAGAGDAGYLPAESLSQGVSCLAVSPQTKPSDGAHTQPPQLEQQPKGCCNLHITSHSTLCRHAEHTRCSHPA